MKNKILLDFDQWYADGLKIFLDKNLPQHLASESYLYSLIPWGKLFRPKLCASLFFDLNQKDGELFQKNLMSACLFLELHHTYSLAHDDLPCMDDDDFRRGKPSLHRAFNEWQALLTGDGLINLSYLSLAQIKSPKRSDIFKLAASYMGPCGLIHGQFLDLSKESTKGIAQILLTHELKTARLIQLSLLFPLYISEKKISLDNFKFFWRLGRSLGLVFQLIDDLNELAEKETITIKAHEKEINPWPSFYQELTPIVLEHLSFLACSNKYQNLFALISNYLLKMEQNLTSKKSTIIKDYPDLGPSLSLLLLALNADGADADGTDGT